MILALFLLQLLCLFPTFFYSLGTHFEQGLSGHKSSTIGSGELINDCVPPKDPEKREVCYFLNPSYVAVISVFLF
jgi:hypothetical protein